MRGIDQRKQCAARIGVGDHSFRADLFAAGKHYSGRGTVFYAYFFYFR